VAVLGSGPNALSCANYLALIGCLVEVFDHETRPGGELLQLIQNGSLPQSAWENDWKGIQRENLHFYGNRRLGTDLNLENLIQTYDAVYLAFGEMNEYEAGHLGSILGQTWPSQVNKDTGQLESHPKVFIGEPSKENLLSVVAAAALGRRMAAAVSIYLDRI